MYTYFSCARSVKGFSPKSTGAWCPRARPFFGALTWGFRTWETPLRSRFANKILVNGWVAHPNVAFCATLGWDSTYIDRIGV
jgi:hypothetical protein